MPTESYRASQCTLWWGGSAFLAEITPNLAGDFALQGQGNAFRARRLTGTGRVGVSADGVSAGYGATIPVYAGDEADKIVANREGVLMVDRLDAGRIWAVPMVITGIQESFAPDGAAMLTVTLAQRGEGNAVEGPRDTVAGNKQLTTGQEGYVRSATAINRRTGNFALAAQEVAVIGSPLVAEGS